MLTQAAVSLNRKPCSVCASLTHQKLYKEYLPKLVLNSWELSLLPGGFQPFFWNVQLTTSLSAVSAQRLRTDRGEARPAQSHLPHFRETNHPRDFRAFQSSGLPTCRPFSFTPGSAVTPAHVSWSQYSPGSLCIRCDVRDKY
ncbi:hypothetical protein R6Z07F_015757 [Ovis aries]